MPLCISLDFDGTYSADPRFWKCFANIAAAFGHEVVTVTHRRKTFENEKQMRGAGVTWPIIFAYDKPKKRAAIEAGHDVSVWIDNNPVGIGDGSEDTTTQSVFEIELRNAHREIIAWSRIERNDNDVLRLAARIETVLGGDA